MTGDLPMCVRVAWRLVVVLCAARALVADEGPGADAGIPAAWQGSWQQPAAGDRPLQIVHGIPSDPKLTGQQRTAAIAARLDAWQAHGLGGVVCNVPFHNYMQSEEDWKALTEVIRQCRERQLVVWIYDEQGYPSGAAGGLVLRENPAFEALELAFDTAREDPFLVRPSYEFTHANNNYHASRRYINLLDADAVACFVRNTHDQYWKRLEPFFGDPIVAMFTDEPSLLAVSLGQIPEQARRGIPVLDRPDPNVKPLPAVPWCRDLPDQYRQRFGEDLLAQRRSLFVGDTEADRQVRRQYWSLVADLVTERYFGALGAWCHEHGVASSGHTLVEESILLQSAVEGNGLQVLSRMQIPGLDALSSDPEAVIHIGWLTAGLPASAAALTGQRRVMTEVSDFVQKMGNAGPASLAEMQATAAWQATWGVTEFTLYYSQADRPIEQYRAYCDFVGRLNAVLKPAERVSEVLLYYPMYDLWAEYRPVAEQLGLPSQSTRLQQIVASFTQLGQTLQRNQIPFVLIDHKHLARAEIEADGAIRVGGQRYRSIVIPEGALPPPEVTDLLARAQERSAVAVCQGDSAHQLLDSAAFRTHLQPTYRIEPASPHIALGRFTREGHPLLVLVNVARQDYDGQLWVARGFTWHALDPASGSQRPLPASAEGVVPLHLAPRETCVLLGTAAE